MNCTLPSVVLVILKVCNPYACMEIFALGTVPIIRSPRGNAAEMVAEKLDKKLRENLRDTRNSLFMMDASQGGHYR